jgi:hypothetical protein
MFESNIDNEFAKDLLQEALIHLVDRDLISMTWDEEEEDFLFFMTDEQKKMPVPEDLL